MVAILASTHFSLCRHKRRTLAAPWPVSNSFQKPPEGCVNQPFQMYHMKFLIGFPHPPLPHPLEVCTFGCLVLAAPMRSAMIHISIALCVIRTVNHLCPASCKGSFAVRCPSRGQAVITDFRRSATTHSFHQPTSAWCLVCLTICLVYLEQTAPIPNPTCGGHLGDSTFGQSLTTMHMQSVNSLNIS